MENQPVFNLSISLTLDQAQRVIDALRGSDAVAVMTQAGPIPQEPVVPAKKRGRPARNPGKREQVNQATREAIKRVGAEPVRELLKESFAVDRVTELEEDALDPYLEAVSALQEA